MIGMPRHADDDTPWTQISTALSDRLTAIDQSFLLGARMQEASSLFLRDSNPIRIWLMSNAYNIHSRGTLKDLANSIERANTPGFLVRYACCCFYQNSIRRSNNIRDALRDIMRAKSVTEILGALQSLNGLVVVASSGAATRAQVAPDVSYAAKAHRFATEDDDHERIIVGSDRLHMK